VKVKSAASAVDAHIIPLTALARIFVRDFICSSL